jgi:hypothetical protein
LTKRKDDRVVLPDCFGFAADPDGDDAATCHGDKHEKPCILRTRCLIGQYLARVTLQPVDEVISNLRGVLRVPAAAIGTAYDKPTRNLTLDYQRLAFLAMADDVAKLLDRPLEKWPTDNWQPDSFALLHCHWALHPDKALRNAAGQVRKKITPAKKRLSEDWRKNTRPELWYKSPFTGIHLAVAAFKEGQIMLYMPADELAAQTDALLGLSKIHPKSTKHGRWTSICRATFQNAEEAAQLIERLFPLLIGRHAANLGV